MEIPQQLISPNSLATFGGISIAVVAITNSFKNALGWSPSWLAWVLAIAICLCGAVLKTPKPDAIGYVIAFVNGCIVYCSASGMNLVGTVTSKKLGTPSHAALGLSEAGRAASRPFFENWFK